MDFASVIVKDPQIQANTACFAGTRVPVRSLFDALAHGRSLGYFLEQFPAVSRAQVEKVLQLASELVDLDAPAALDALST